MRWRDTRSVRPNPVTDRLGSGWVAGLLAVLVGSVAAFVAFLPWSNTNADSPIRSLVLFSLAHLAAGLSVLVAARGSRSSLAVICHGDPAVHRRQCLTSHVLTGRRRRLERRALPSCLPFLYIAAVRAVRERTATSCLPSGWTGWSSASVSPRSPRPPFWRRCYTSSRRSRSSAWRIPVADLTLLIVLVTLAGATRLRLDPRLALLGSGFGLVLVTDLAYLLLGSTRSYHGGALVDLGLLPALLPLAAAACLACQPVRPTPSRRSRSVGPRSRHPPWRDSPPLPC